jgi:hypothetical protein
LQPWLMSALPSAISMALKGQTGAHSPQPVHFRLMTAIFATDAPYKIFQ